MALFRNYEKEGPGVDPDEPDRGPFIEFFANYFSKFWKISGLGIFNTLASIVPIAILYFLGFSLIQMLFPALSFDNISSVIKSMDYQFAEGIDATVFSSHLYIGTHLIFVATVFILQFFVFGPTHAATTYIMRNYSQRRPVFFWSDLKDAFKANWKQSLIHSLLSSALVTLVIYAFYFYTANLAPGFFKYILQTLIVIILVLITIMNFYVYQMLVTFDLKLKDIYRNSLILTMAKLPTNLIILIIILLLVAVIPFFLLWSIFNLGVGVGILLYLLLLASGFVLFLINYFASRGIQKYMIDDIDDDSDGAGSTISQHEFEDRSEDWHYTEDIPKDTKEAPEGSPA